MFDPLSALGRRAGGAPTAKRSLCCATSRMQRTLLLECCNAEKPRAECPQGAGASLQRGDAAPVPVCRTLVVLGSLEVLGAADAGCLCCISACQAAGRPSLTHDRNRVGGGCTITYHVLVMKCKAFAEAHACTESRAEQSSSCLRICAFCMAVFLCCNSSKLLILNSSRQEVLAQRLECCAFA